MNISEQNTILNIFLNDILMKRMHSNTGLCINNNRVTMYQLKTSYSNSNWGVTLQVSFYKNATLTLDHIIPMKYMHKQEGRHLYQLAENTVEQLLSKSR